MNNQWKEFISDKKRAILFGFLLVTCLFFVSMFTRFMIWNEGRAGYILNDHILNIFQPINLSRLTMSLTLIPIFIGMLLIFRKPASTVYFFFLGIFICVLRALTLYLVPLDPPLGIIPLTDPIIEKLFYGGNVLKKDLFFSGHTANIIIIGLLADIKIYRNIMYACAAIVGFLLMWQHVHYSIDVFAAPFFAVLAYKMSVYAGNHTLLRQFKSIQCNGSIFGKYQGLKEGI